MTARLAIRRARPLDEYPPLVLVTAEADVLPVVRVERCACGTRIRQLEGDDVAAIVRAHNMTAAHQAWRDAR